MKKEHKKTARTTSGKRQCKLLTNKAGINLSFILV